MFERVVEELRACGGQSGGWAFIGSAAMAAAGIPVVPGDVDVFARAHVAEGALARGWREEVPDPEDPPMLTWHDGDRPVALWDRWRHRARWARVEPTVAEVLDGARRLENGVWIMDLRLLATWKWELLQAGMITAHRKAKDHRHLALLIEAGIEPYPAGDARGLDIEPEWTGPGPNE
jgi:hypothetical protein